MPISETTQEKPSGFLTFLWALFFFFVFALVVFIWVRASGTREVVDDKRGAARVAKLAELDKAEHAKLATVGWVDQGKGVVRIPISEAKKLVLAELKSKKVAASQVKVEPPLPMPPPPDPNATEPAPPALPSSPQGADTLRFDLPQATGSPVTSPATAPAIPPQPSAPPTAPGQPATAPAAPPSPQAPAPPGTTSPTAVPGSAAPTPQATPAAVPPAQPQPSPVPPQRGTPAAPAAPAPERPPLIKPTEPSTAK